MTQKERVVQYMRDFGSITTMEAFVDLGVTRLASRIHDLENDGVKISRKTESGKNRYGEKIHFTRYFLKDML